jgi:hypothetical protein
MSRSKVLIFILLGGLIIFGTELIGAEPSQHPPSTTISTSQTVWSTCVNSYGGYSFQYPSSWHVLKSGNGAPIETACEDAGANFSINPIDPNYATSSYGGDYTAGSIQFYFTKATELAAAPKSLDDFFSQNPAILQSNKFLTNGTVGGEKAVWLQEEPENGFVDIYLWHDGNIIDITADKVSDTGLLNGVLDSFKFDR